MPINTPRIGLFKKDTLTEGTDTFNIKTMMNDNWDQLDKKVALIDPLTGKLLPGQENATEVDLSDLATKQELLAVDQKVTTHLADYVANPGVATTTNVGNAYAVTLNPAPASYVNAMGLIVTINANSTGASTINVNGKGAIPLKNSNGNPVTNLKKDGVYTVRYSAGAFILQGEGGSGNALASDLLSGKTASTDAGDIIGTMPIIAASAPKLTAQNQIYTIPAGFHNGAGFVQATYPAGVLFKTGYQQLSVVRLEVTGLGFMPVTIVVSFTYPNGIDTYQKTYRFGNPDALNRAAMYTHSNGSIVQTIGENAGFTITAEGFETFLSLDQGSFVYWKAFSA